MSKMAFVLHDTVSIYKQMLATVTPANQIIAESCFFE